METICKVRAGLWIQSLEIACAEGELTLTIECICNDFEAIAHAAAAVPVLHVSNGQGIA